MTPPKDLPSPKGPSAYSIEADGESIDPQYQTERYTVRRNGVMVATFNTLRRALAEIKNREILDRTFKR